MQLYAYMCMQNVCIYIYIHTYIDSGVSMLRNVKLDPGQSRATSNEASEPVRKTLELETTGKPCM